MTTPIQKLHALGQSIWYDNIQRRLLLKSPGGEKSEMAAMIERGDIRGVTSNPSIFNNAIAKSNDYNSALIPMAWSGWDAEQIFWQLAIEDIRDACDLFSPLYQESVGADGFVSIEVNPALAHDTKATLTQAKQLWERVKRPNLMVKIPATTECLPAIRAAIAAGININITLIFSLERYHAVMDAYLGGLDERLADGLPVDNIASVASFFVSRMDTKVDGLLPDGSPLRGMTAIAYTKLAYQEYRKVFGGRQFSRYQAAGCHPQRPLWASTSTKNPAYSDTLYVDSLIGPGTVDTVPQKTIDAFLDHGVARVTITEHLDESLNVIRAVEAMGISMDKVTSELEEEGVKTFADAFGTMLKTIEERCSVAVGALGPLAGPTKQRVSNMIADSSPARLWSHDPTLWSSEKTDQDEIVKRLGWLSLPHSSRPTLIEIRDFVSQVHADGFTHVLLLGMGGSSLAPEVISQVFSPAIKTAVYFSTLDSTDPVQIIATDKKFPPEKTLYIVSSKSGETAEVNALFNYFWKRAGCDGRHFVAITDPGTKLEALAVDYSFRKIFLAEATVGGRYSALTHFGLVPAALMGVDLDLLLDRAAWMMHQCAVQMTGARNPGMVLGAILGQAAMEGRDKLTLLADDSVAPFGAWLEQLVAESSGKRGKGIIPVVGEDETDIGSYGEDRLFVYLRMEGRLDSMVTALQKAGHPVLVFDIPDAYDLGSEFYRWEFAVATACSIMGVNAFDQPDVRDSKDRTKKRLIAYSHSKNFNESQPLWGEDGIRAFSTLQLNGTGLGKNLQLFLGSAQKGDYIAINAYLPRNPEMKASLAQLRHAIQMKTGCATTLGFGPRFLHSTGQLHKGGPDSGLFLQITADPIGDLDIPGQGMSFGSLERAQALGDYEALDARGRRILRLNMPTLETIKVLNKVLK